MPANVDPSPTPCPIHDISQLVALREAHETTDAKKGVRRSGEQMLRVRAKNKGDGEGEGNTFQVHRELDEMVKRVLLEENNELSARAKAGTDCRVQWGIEKAEEIQRAEEKEKVNGNVANAAAARQARATKVPRLSLSK